MKSNEAAEEKRAELSSEASVSKDRREFLEKCGRFAAYTTPAVVMLLHFQEREASAYVTPPV